MDSRLRGNDGGRSAFPAALIGILCCGLAAAAPVAAQDTRALLDRMERMERDMTTLQQQIYRGGGGGSSTVITSPALGGGVSAGASAAPAPLPADAATRIEVRMGALEEQIRRLTGQVEETQFRTQQLHDRLERMQADTDLRLKELQDGATPAAAAPPAPAAGEGVLGTMPKKELDAASGATALQGATAKEQYDHAYGLVMKDRDAAEKALLAFIAAHPNDALTGNAYYWLGETYFVKGDFKQAAVQFLDGYRKFPKSDKAAHNLLKLGMSLARTDDAKSACAAFAKLQQEYPNTDATIKRTVQSERQKAKCP